MYEFESKTNNKKAINRIKNFNIKVLTDEDKYFLAYKFPANTRGYTSSAIRGYELVNIDLKKLIQYYRDRAMLDSYTRSGLATTILFKLYKEQEFSVEDLEEVKNELLQDMVKTDEKPLKQNFNDGDVLYILHIRIGSDYFYKFGITEGLNSRLRSLKSKLRSYPGYESRCIEISVIKEERNLTNYINCEYEIKDIIRTKKIKRASYFFEGGGTETIDKEHYKRFIKLFNSIVQKYKY